MRIKEIKIVNQDQSTEIADIGADAINVDYNDTTVKQKLDSLDTDNNMNKNNISNLQSQISELANGSPAGVYATVTALTSADPDHSRIYVVTENGHWYYYNNGWQDGGVYQTSQPSDAISTLSNKISSMEDRGIRSFFTDFINYPINRFDKDNISEDCIAGAIINEPVANVNFDLSNIIEVMQGKTYCFSTVPNTSDKRIMFYDKAGNSLGNTWINENTENPTVVAPNNAWYCRFNIKKADHININTFMFVEGAVLPESYTQYIKPELSDKINIQPDEKYYYNPLRGKKLAAVGDSITYGYAIDIDENTGIRMTYAGQVAYNNQMEYINYGISGSTMVSNGPNGFSNTRYKNMAADLDYITIWFGWNDCGLLADGTSQLGNINSTDTTTFYGAWNTVMNYLINNYRQAKIGLIVPYVSITHDQETLGVNIRQAVRDIAKKWGITCLDLYSYNVPLFYNREPSDNVDATASKRKRDRFLADGCHPNQNGYNFLSTIYENYLRSL